MPDRALRLAPPPGAFEQELGRVHIMLDKLPGFCIYSRASNQL
jgi:hypothetical protein